jgi:myo-inositol-1(or 4)-monophosphatase
MSDERTVRADLTLRAAKAGGSVASEYFRTDVPVERKDGKTDVVTEADRIAQRRVIETIRDEFVEDAIVGEEDDELKQVPDNGPAWIIDPIDGTNNFVRGIRVWATSVAAVVDGEPVAAATVMPAMGDTYWQGPSGVFRNGDRISVSDRTDSDLFAVCPTIWWPPERRDEYAAIDEAIVQRFGDMRRFGCAQAVLAMVADGAIDGTATNVVANPWDTVAGVAMIREAGGTVTDLNGDRWRHDSRGLVASNGEAHGEVLAAARAAEDERT